MQKNEVIDLHEYRVAEEEDPSFDAAAPQHLPAGTTLLLGQYTITDYLNCGGFGITYRAQDSLGREVVIKECFPSEMAYRSGKLMGARTPKFREELSAIVQHFVKEAHHLASARHDNVVHVHQIFEENDTAYMAMDHIDGQDLLDIVETDPTRYSPREIQQMVRKMLHAISYVHGLGMLHRDISPDNILIDKMGEPILIDFGSALKYASQPSYRAFSKLKFVKDGYSPQEFYIAGSEQGTWSDLYSFAASMYHVISGKVPEDAQKRLAALAAKKPDPYVPLAGNVTGYPMRFLKSLDKALRILPDQRIQTADEWLKLLETKKPKEEVETGVPVAGVLEKLPAYDDLRISSLIAKLFANRPGQVAAGVAGAVLILGIAIYGPKFASPSEVAQATVASAPVLTATDPRPFLFSMSNDGFPQSAALAQGVTAADAEIVRASKPSAIAASPILQPGPALGLAPSIGAPVIVIDGTDLPENTTPAARVANVLPMTLFELVSVPQVSVSEPGGIAEPDIITETPKIPSGARPLPNTTGVSLLAAPGLETTPEASAVPVQPLISDLEKMEGFNSPEADLNELSLASAQTIERPGTLSGLPKPVAGEAAFSADLEAPPLDRVGPLAGTQIAFAHWDVRMPFEADLERVRNANTAVITSIDEAADLAISGDWIAEGVIIYSFNGDRLEADTPLNVHVLKSLTIDPDGYARATVRYRNPTADILDRGLLAVPVVREMGMADGTVIEARMIDLAWVMEVTALGEVANGLKVGDILTGEATTGNVFATPEALTETLEQLVSRRIETADLTVVRGGETLQAEWPLARNIPAVRQ